MSSFFGLASLMWYVKMCSDQHFSVLAYEFSFAVIGREQLLHVVMGLLTRSDLVCFLYFCGIFQILLWFSGGICADARCIFYHHASCIVIIEFCHEVFYHLCCILWDNRTQACLPQFIFKQPINNKISLSHTPVILGLILSDACIYLSYFLMKYKQFYLWLSPFTCLSLAKSSHGVTLSTAINLAQRNSFPKLPNFT